MYRLGSRVSINLGLSQAIHPKNKNRAYSRHSGCQTRYRPSRHAFSSSYLGRSWGNILSKFGFSKWSYWPKNGLIKFLQQSRANKTLVLQLRKRQMNHKCLFVCPFLLKLNPSASQVYTCYKLIWYLIYLISDISDLSEIWVVKYALWDFLYH